MNLLLVLRERIEAIPQGDYTSGLKSVLQHTEVATKHLEHRCNLPDEPSLRGDSQERISRVSRKEPKLNCGCNF